MGLADEYDAAQDRGEVAKGRPKSVGDGDTFQATAADIGFFRQIAEETGLSDYTVRRAINPHPRAPQRSINHIRA